MQEKYIIELKDLIGNELVEALGKNVFKAKSLPISYRMISHWHKNDLFLFKTEKGKNRNFSVIDYLWVLLIKRLRKYEMGLSAIKKIKDQCNASLYEVLVSLFMSYSQETDDDVKKQYKWLFDILKESGSESELKTELEKSESRLFSLFVALVFHQEIDILLRISANDELNADFVVLEKSNGQASRILAQIAEDGGLFVSIQSLINEFYDEDQFNWEEIGALSIAQEERSVIQLMRRENMKSLKVVYKNGKLNHAETEFIPIEMSVSSFNTKTLSKAFTKTEVMGNHNGKLVVKTSMTHKI